MEWEAHGVAEQFSNGRVLPGDTHHEKRVDGGKGLQRCCDQRRKLLTLQRVSESIVTCHFLPHEPGASFMRRCKLRDGMPFSSFSCFKVNILHYSYKILPFNIRIVKEPFTLRGKITI